MQHNTTIAEWIKTTEVNFNTDFFTFQNRKIWPLIRLNLLPSIIYSGFRSAGISNNPSIRKVISALLSLIFSQSIEKKKVTCLHFCDVSFYTLSNGLVVHKMSGPLADETRNGAHLFLDSTDGIKSLLQAHPYKNISRQITGYRIVASIMAYVASFFVRRPHWWIEYDAFCKANYDRAPNFKRFLKTYYQVMRLSAYFGDLLDRTKPDLCTITSYYSIKGIAFVYACRKKGIPVVDIQHGLQGNTHYAYTDLDEGRNDSLFYPSHFWKWQQEDEISGEAYIYGGHPWIHFIRKNRSVFEQEVYNFDRRLRANHKAILVTLQSFDSYDVYQDLFAYIRDSQDTYDWIIRAHPVMLKSGALDQVKDKLQSFDITTDYLVTDTVTPLIFTLEASSVHITAYSSVVLEAHQLGIPNILLVADGHQIFKSIPLEVCLSRTDLERTIPRLVNEGSSSSGQEALSESFQRGIRSLQAIAGRRL